METAEYRPLAQAGAEGLVVYQETYDRAVYARHAHRRAEAQFRLAPGDAGAGLRGGVPAPGHRRALRPGRLAAARRSAWRPTPRICCAIAGRRNLTISLPRLRPCAGEFQPLTHMSDRELVQLVCAFRLMFPDVGLVLSTREPAKLRDGLIPLGITLISAGSHTEPGGYTGAGKDKLHHTERGRIVELGASEWAASGTERPGHRPVPDRRRALAAGGGGLDPPARLRAGVEGLGCGADCVRGDRRPSKSTQASHQRSSTNGGLVIANGQEVPASCLARLKSSWSRRSSCRAAWWWSTTARRWPLRNFPGASSTPATGWKS